MREKRKHHKIYSKSNFMKIFSLLLLHTHFYGTIFALLVFLKVGKYPNSRWRILLSSLTKWFNKNQCFEKGAYSAVMPVNICKKQLRSQKYTGNSSSTIQRTPFKSVRNAWEKKWILLSLGKSQHAPNPANHYDYILIPSFPCI